MPSYAVIKETKLPNSLISFDVVFKCDDDYQETQCYVGKDQEVLVAACKHMNDERMASAKAPEEMEMMVKPEPELVFIEVK